jgi:hypoxanthine phosphoribosyltransferase
MDIVFTAEQIQQRVAELGRHLAGDYRDRPLTIVGVLTGSLIFLADLIRNIELPVRIGLIQASSYHGTTSGELRIGPELIPDVTGRHLLLLDDILDTGKTLARLKERMQELSPLSVKVAVLLRRLGVPQVLQPDYVGFELPSEAFVVGYGLDYNDEYRHLPYVANLPGT